MISGQRLYSIGKRLLFSSVAKITIVIVLFALVSIKNWYLEQLDVNNVFPHGDLKEEEYMSLYLIHSASNIKSYQVCKLHKSIYGLKQTNKHAMVLQIICSLKKFEVHSISGKPFPQYQVRCHKFHNLIGIC